MTSKCRLQWFFFLTFFQTLFVHKCVYTGRIRSLKNGCARYCNATVTVRRVCVWPGTSPRPPQPIQEPADWAALGPQGCESEVASGSLTTFSCKGSIEQSLHVVATLSLPRIFASIPCFLWLLTEPTPLTRPCLAHTQQCPRRDPHPHPHPSVCAFATSSLSMLCQVFSGLALLSSLHSAVTSSVTAQSTVSPHLCP